MIGEMIGQYRIIEKIGEGGMGVVYKAEQQQPKRMVALKVIRADRYMDDNTLRLFEREIRSLALLKHPSIAGIYESGRTEEGQHYFAMELVEGEPLSDWLYRQSNNSITPAEVRFRLSLFRKICDAVAYAHQRGVIHRDLKPSNILVLEKNLDESGTSADLIPDVKVLDFGLARITESDVAATSLSTEVGTVLGTLQYMSPEQVNGVPGAIDLRTDIFTLGIILHEILTGNPPYDVREMAINHAAAKILMFSPTPLKDVWQGTRNPDRDLEIILHKALQREPEERYQTTLALSEDLERFLNNQPISARPQSAVYQLQKMVRRHKLAFSSLAVIVGLLVGFALVTKAQVVRIAAAQEASETTTNFLCDMLTSLYQQNFEREEIGYMIEIERPVVEVIGDVLDATAIRVIGEFAHLPTTRAQLHHVLGSVYASILQPEKAEVQFINALHIRNNVLGADDSSTLDTMLSLSRLYVELGRFEESEQYAQNALKGCLETLGEDDFMTLYTMNTLVLLYTYSDQLEVAAQIAQRATEGWIRRRDAGLISEQDARKEVAERGIAFENAIGISMMQGQFEEALSVAYEAYEQDLENSGPEAQNTLASMHNIASILHVLGRHAQAESLYTETLGLREQVLGESHPHTLYTKGNLAEIFALQERWEEAETQFLNTIALFSSDVDLGITHFRAQRYISSLAEMYEAWGKLDRAAEWRAKLIPRQ
ncbi:tetratricopeptide repeat protein [Gemmatimonadota bacterium]